jgi:hypothetical protein
MVIPRKDETEKPEWYPSDTWRYLWYPPNTGKNDLLTPEDRQIVDRQMKGRSGKKAQTNQSDGPVLKVR